MAARLRTALLPPAAVLAAHGAHTFTSDVPGLAPVEHGTPALVAEHIPGSELDIAAAPPGTGPGTATGTGANLWFLCRAMSAGGLAALLVLLLPRSLTLLGRPSARLRSRLRARPAQPRPPSLHVLCLLPT